MDTILPNTSTRKAKQSYWAKQIAKWERSGLTQVQFCLENNLKKHTFIYWKSKRDRKQEAQTLLPVSIMPDGDTRSSCCSSGISLTFCDRFTIHLETRFDAQALSQVIEILQAR